MDWKFVAIPGNLAKLCLENNMKLIIGQRLSTEGLGSMPNIKSHFPDEETEGEEVHCLSKGRQLCAEAWTGSVESGPKPFLCCIYEPPSLK